MSTAQTYDGWKCAPPDEDPDEQPGEDPCEACEQQVEELTAEIGQRDARIEALEIELATLRESSILVRMSEEVGKQVPGSWSVSVQRSHFLSDYGRFYDRLEYVISWWPVEGGGANTIRAQTAAEALALFHATLKEPRS